MANDSVGLDAAFLNKEVELGRHAFFEFELRSLDEEAVDADVEDAGDIVAAVAAPANPDILRGGKPGDGATGVGRLSLQSELPGTAARC